LQDYFADSAPDAPPAQLETQEQDDVFTTIKETRDEH